MQKSPRMEVIHLILVYFTVERKDGSTSYYGNNSNSRQLGKDSKTLTWGINKFEDSFDNPIIFHYTNSPANGFALDKIYYAFGDSTTATTSNSFIEFIYDTNRPDPTQGYMAGHALNNKLRLTRIDSRNADDNGNSQLIRSYHLNYQALPSSPRAQDALISRLESIEECIDTSGMQCMPATTFDWSEQFVIGDSNASLLRRHSSLAGNNDSVSGYRLLDFNGDGLKDVFWIKAYPDGGGGADQSFHYAESTETGFINRNFHSGHTSFPYNENPSDENGIIDLYVVDYNADGREDLIAFHDQTNVWELYLSTPQADGSWRLDRRGINLPFNHFEGMAFGDINSDGLVDAIQYVDYENAAHSGPVPAPQLLVYMLQRDTSQAVTSDRAYSFSSPITHSLDLPHIITGSPANFDYNTIQEMRIADLNGDGKAELLGSLTNRHSCFQNPMQQTYPQFYCQSTTDLVALPIESSGSVDVKTLVADVIDTVYDSDAEDDVVNFTQGDINGDGLLDIVYQKNNTNKHEMVALNKGDFTFEHQLLGDGSNIDYQQKSLAIIDLNADGYGDLFWHDEDANQRRISYWQPTVNNGEFSTTLHTFPASDDWSYSYANVDGDAELELVQLYSKQGQNKKIEFWNLDTLPDGHHSIDTITNGLGAVTNIEYSPLSDTDHYQRIKGISSTTETQIQCMYLGYITNDCIPHEVEVAVANASDFYRNINAPFHDLPSGAQTLNPEMTAPILEMFGPSTLVTRVSSSAPAANDTHHSQVDTYAESAISYVYHQAKIQAAGRGYLGFKKIQSIDEQTGVVTSTQYRQDFPFIGMPIKTEVRTADDKLLSESTNEWKLKSYKHGDFGSGLFNTAMTDAPTEGCKVLGALQPILSKSVETTYSTTSENNQSLVVTSSPLQTVITSNTYSDDQGNLDEHGNVYKNIVEHRIGSATGTLAKKQITTNLYNSTNGWTSDEAKRFGRLSQTTVRASALGEYQRHYGY